MEIKKAMQLIFNMFERIHGPLRKAIEFNAGKAKPLQGGKKRPSNADTIAVKDLELHKGVKMIAVEGHPVISHITSFKQAPGGEEAIYLYSHKQMPASKWRNFQAKFNLGELRRRLVLVEHEKYTIESAGFRGLYFIKYQENAAKNPQLVGRINFYGSSDNSFHVGVAKEHAEKLAKLLLEGKDAPLTATVANPKP